MVSPGFSPGSRQALRLRLWAELSGVGWKAGPAPLPVIPWQSGQWVAPKAAACNRMDASLLDKAE